MKKPTVISTGFNAPTKAQCLESVASQWGGPYEHRYIEASEQKPPRDVITNLSAAVADLSPWDVVVWLDGDDHLARPGALQTVEWMHQTGAWLTYGSFAFADGRPGFAAEYTEAERAAGVRAAPWKATHAKSFRAGLVQRLRAEDLSWPEGAAVCWDMLVMFAAIEMAGWTRTLFCPTVLAIYNLESSHEFRHGAAGRAEQVRWEAVIRARAPYERLEAL